MTTYYPTCDMHVRMLEKAVTSLSISLNYKVTIDTDYINYKVEGKQGLA